MNNNQTHLASHNDTVVGMSSEETPPSNNGQETPDDAPLLESPNAHTAMDTTFATAAEYENVQSPTTGSNTSHNVPTPTATAPILPVAHDLHPLPQSLPASEQGPLRQKHQNQIYCPPTRSDKMRTKNRYLQSSILCSMSWMKTDKVHHDDGPASSVHSKESFSIRQYRTLYQPANAKAAGRRRQETAEWPFVRILIKSISSIYVTIIWVESTRLF